MPVERLFVYGTLAPGRSNEAQLAHVSGTWEPASVRGRLLQLGWGAGEGYPGIILDQAGHVVNGLVFTSEELESVWHTLDAFEGDEYNRIETAVLMDDGTTVHAYIYVLSEPDRYEL